MLYITAMQGEYASIKIIILKLKLNISLLNIFLFFLLTKMKSNLQ